MFQDYLLHHLADSALPAGSFAYSAGMEAMLEFGFITDEESLGNYVYDYALQNMAFELPFINSFFDLYDPAKKEELAAALRHYDATFIASSMYNASLAVGKNWVRVMEQVFEMDEDTREIKSWLRQQKLPLHYLFIATASLKLAGFEKSRIHVFHIGNIIRDQLSAAIRLGITGPIKGHNLQYLIYSKLCSETGQYADKDHTSATKSGFIPEMAQMLQKNVYSKLFKS